MMNSLSQQGAKLTWIGPSPDNGKRVALLIPQYNECSNCDFMYRLSYFKSVAKEFRNEMDVIIIDDGSTDNSLGEIKLFLRENENAFYLAAVSPNSNKVGALFLTAYAVSHEFVVLSDFDTDITGYNKVLTELDQLGENSLFMGFYFRMIPFEGKGFVFIFQQLEYALLRSLYKFYKKEGSVPVMPGAGTCYKRAELLSIYKEHSGLRNGEDREATMIGLKMGYRTYYKQEVLSLTRPPLSFKALIKQRVRWNLGYLETYQKERKYYYKQVRILSSIGIIFMLDLVAVALMIIFPFLVLILGILNLDFLLKSLLVLYMVSIGFCINFLLTSQKEFVELKGKILLSVLLFPVFKVVVGHFSWLKAIRTFFKKNKPYYFKWSVK